MSTDPAILDKLKQTTLALLRYCQKENWAGYDPYDALNSKLFAATPFYRSKYCRIALTQLLKRLPINIRPLLLIDKEQNPKALALFLMAFIKLKKLGLLPDGTLIQTMVDRLIALRSPDHLINPSNPSNSSNSTNPSNPSNSYFCWGYSFPWQGREVLVPRGAPNLVCTVFVANALLDLHEAVILDEQADINTDHASRSVVTSSPVHQSTSPPVHQSTSPRVHEFTSSPVRDPNTQHPTPNTQYLDMALSAAEYILNELYWEEDDAVGFSYPLPSVRAKVHNANFLAAALLCRVCKLSGDKKFLEPALKAARYSASRQNPDGSWFYGELPTQHWIDNFHTGYNLCALQSMKESTGLTEFDEQIKKGFAFYRASFFEPDGVVRYFHNRTYPIDIHSIAQSIITLTALDKLRGNESLTSSMFGWAHSNMCNGSG